MQEAIALEFAKFAEPAEGNMQVHLWMRQERLPLPAAEYAAEGRRHRPGIASRQHIASDADQPGLCWRCPGAYAVSASEVAP